MNCFPTQIRKPIFHLTVIFILISILKSFGQESLNESGKVKPGETSTTDKNILYEVKKGDTWFGIAKSFKISYPELRLANDKSGDKLFPGMKINIPGQKLKPTDPFYQKKKTEEVKYHTVKNSETLYGIAKMYGLSVKNLKQLNNLSSNTIHPGQKLIVSKSVVTSDVKSSDEKIFFAESRAEVNENGFATVIDEEASENNNEKYFAYHRTAPAGTIIQLTCKSNSKKIFVKIKGQPNDSPDNKESIIAVSKASAQLLGITEKKFEVSLLYGVDKK